MKLGKRIKQLRIKSNLTQESLAEQLNVSMQSVSKWENDVSMPDITLLPKLSEILGVSIDELFDLSVEQKLARIERRLDIEEPLLHNDFVEIEEYLKEQVESEEHKYRATSLMAYLYTCRVMSDSKKIEKYAKQAIRMKPNEKNCEWMLGKAGNYQCFDWNINNHTSAINFFREVAEGNPNLSLPLCYLIDNLIADHRTDEAEAYIQKYEKLRPDNVAMIAAYKAENELARFNEAKADAIMAQLEKDHPEDAGCLFEIAQYHAKKANYSKAINYYESSFAQDTQRPRYIDALLSIADIYDILGDIGKEVETLGRIIACCKEEWGMDEEIELKEHMERRDKLLQKLNESK